MWVCFIFLPLLLTFAFQKYSLTKATRQDQKNYTLGSLLVILRSLLTLPRYSSSFDASVRLKLVVTDDLFFYVSQSLPFIVKVVLHLVSASACLGNSGPDMLNGWRWWWRWCGVC